jgi:hypothetical protein
MATSPAAVVIVKLSESSVTPYNTLKPGAM